MTHFGYEWTYPFISFPIRGFSGASGLPEDCLKNFFL
jgi:hypothetical protein